MYRFIHLHLLLFRKITEYTIVLAYECSYYNETVSFKQFSDMRYWMLRVLNTILHLYRFKTTGFAENIEK